MKKLFLFIFALFFWTGAWAQTNLSLGKHVYPAGSSVEGVTEDALQGITNGNEDDEVNISKWDGQNLTAQSFYVDLGETKEIGSVKIIWQGAAAHAYKIYAATEKVGDAEPTWGATEIGSQTNVTRWNTSKIELTNEFETSVNARYIKIEITDPSGNQAPDWGVKIREMKVYSPFVAQVSTLLFSNYIAKANTGLGLSIYPKDQAGNTFNGNVTLTISPVVSNANINNDTKYIAFPGDIAAGTYTITATDANSNTASQKIVFVSEAAPNPTADNSNVHGVYSETYNATSPGISDPSWNWKYTSYDQLELASGNNCYRVHNVGTFGLNNAAFDVSGYKYLHFDIYADENVNGYVSVEASDITNKAFSLTGGQWNSIDIDISSCSDLNDPTWIQLYIGNNSSDNQRDVLIDNVYFYKEPTFTLTATPGTSTFLLGGATGSTTNITTTVTEGENDVTSSSTITYESNNTNVVSVSNSGVVTATGLGSATVTVSATYNEITKTEDIDFAVIPIADAEPTDAAADVLSIYSDKYTSSSTATPSTVGKYNGASWDTIEETTLGASDNVYHATNSTGFGFGVGQNITNYVNINVSIFPSEDVTGHFFIEGVDGGNKTINFTLTGGQWNKVYKDIASISGTDSYTYFILDKAVSHLYVDNFYFKKPGENEVITHVNGNSADVYGTVTSSNVASVISDAGFAAVINLKNATISEKITLTPNNSNAVVVVNGDGSGSGRTPNADGLKVTANNIVVYGSSEGNAGKYYRAKDEVTITLIDDNNSQPAYDFVIDAQQDGVNYTRTVAAGKWVSYNSPATVTIPAGVTVYKATDATTTSVTFTKQESQYLGANVPVILHNNTNDDVVITSNNDKIDLNLTANPGGAAIKETGITQFGTARLIEADGTQFALQDNNLKLFKTGAKIGAFRVYFTGLSSASGARAIFVDGETTKIGSINANGEINVEDGVYYNLAGQRVQNPKKGIYIINGKKVVLK